MSDHQHNSKLTKPDNPIEVTPWAELSLLPAGEPNNDVKQLFKAQMNINNQDIGFYLSWFLFPINLSFEMQWCVYLQYFSRKLNFIWNMITNLE